jgi:hypothetical protein
VSQAGALLLSVVLTLATAAGLALLLDGWPAVGRQERSEEFQRLVGGLGFGPALDLDRCAFAFDPRLCPVCSQDVGPIPGGTSFCPYHASSPFDYPPPAPRREGVSRPDALLP